MIKNKECNICELYKDNICKGKLRTKQKPCKRLRLIKKP